jgi:hypothetical protein
MEKTQKQQHFFGYLGSSKLFNIKRNIPIVRCDALSAILGLFADKNAAKYAIVYAAKATTKVSAENYLFSWPNVQLKTVQFVSPRNGVSTLRVMTVTEMTLWVLTFSMMALGIMTLIKMTKQNMTRI